MAQRRVVRNTPLLSRIKAYPFDTYLYLHEQFETIEWDKLSETVSLPLGFALDAVLLVSRLGTRLLVVSQDQRSEVLMDSGTTLRNSPLAGEVIQGRGINRSFRSWLIGLLSFLSLFLLALSFANAWYVFSKKRTYTFLGRAAEDKTMASTPTTRRALLDVDEENTPSSWSWRTIMNKLHSEKSRSKSDKDVWELQMWNPPLFNLHLFVSFSPLHALILYWTSYITLVRNILIGIVVSAQMYLITINFLQQAKDKSLVFSETFEEYEKKVVRPKLSVVRHDAAVGTDGSVEFSSPVLDNHFVLHDIRPKSSPSSPLQPPSPFRLAAAASAQQGAGLASLRRGRRATGTYSGTPVKFRNESTQDSREYQPSPLSRASIPTNRVKRDQ